MRAQTNYQGGSLLGFVAVGILLAGLLVGGLYFVQRYDNSGESGGEIIATDSETDEKNTSGFTDENEKNESSSTQKNTSSSSTISGTADNDESSTTNESSVSTLPETGPAESLVQAVVLSVVTFGSVSYIRSRRTLDF